MWYEAARRRTEVQQAWVEGKFLFGDNGWQEFTTWVVQNLPVPWSKLHGIEGELAKQGIIKASYSPWSVPPGGYSTFPDGKTKEGKAKQQKVSMQVLHLPQADDTPDVAKRFVELARQFADNGFLIVAVDKKQSEAVRAAFKAILELPPTFRKADLKQVMVSYLPPDISQEDERALEAKQVEGSLTEQDISDVWAKHIKPTTSFTAPWNKIGECQTRILHKRKRDGRLIEETLFNFQNICRELEQFDSGGKSKFVSAVRL